MNTSSLCTLISSLEINGSCSSRVDDVEECLAEHNIYGLRYFVSRDEKKVARINSKGNIKNSNWHEVMIINASSNPVVIDVDTPKRIYLLDCYKKECLIGEGYTFERCEES